MSSWRVRGSALLCALSLLGAMGTRAGELEDRFNHQFALAKEGNAQAMYEVGQMYELGMGTATSHAEALGWYRAAADQGHGAASYQMGYAYYWGKGVERDRRQAFNWFERAANAGNQAAMPYLSKMYALGQGIGQDKAKAAEWAARVRTSHSLYQPPPKPEQPKPAPRPVVEEKPAPAPAPAPAPPPVATVTPVPRPDPQPPAPVPAKRAAPKVKSSPPVRTPRKAKPEEHHKLLLTHEWLKAGRPALYLPSSETACRLDGEVVRCHSAAKRSSLLGRPYEFQVIAEIADFTADGRFALHYQPALIQFLEAPPGAYAADAEQTLGDDALRERVESTAVDLSCRFDGSRLISCTDQHGKASEFTTVKPG